VAGGIDQRDVAGTRYFPDDAKVTRARGVAEFVRVAWGDGEEEFVVVSAMEGCV
jgi:hypothetical protein